MDNFNGLMNLGSGRDLGRLGTPAIESQLQSTGLSGSGGFDVQRLFDTQDRMEQTNVLKRELNAGGNEPGREPGTGNGIARLIKSVVNMLSNLFGQLSGNTNGEQGNNNGLNAQGDQAGTQGTDNSQGADNMGAGGAGESTAKEKELFSEINAERRRKGAPELQWDEAAYKNAKGHSQDMSRTNSMNHNGAMQRLANGGAENVAMGTENSKQIVKMWEGDQGHYQNMLGPQYRKGAVAIVNGAVTLNVS